MALVAIILAADIRFPAGHTLSIAYLLPVLLGFWASSERFTFVTAAATSVLALLDYVISPDPSDGSLAVVSRPLTLLVIWTTAFLVIQLRRAAGVALARTQRAQEYLDIAGVLILVIDKEGRVSLVNRQGEALLGGPAKALIGQSWFDRFIPQESREQARRIFDSPKDAPTAGDELEIIGLDGQRRLIEWRVSSLRDARGGGAGLLCSGEDVTARRQAEDALRRSVKELADLKYAIDQSVIVATTDTTGRIKYVNDKFCEISKYSREELLGQDHRILNSGHHPKEFIRDLWRTIAQGRVWRGEIRNRAKDGTLYWVDTTIVPFRDESGRLYQYMAMRSDVTERKKAEALLQDRKTLVRLGEMAAVVAHEVKNPLAAMKGALQVIGARMPEASRDRAVVGDIVARLDSLNELVQDLLLFARPRAPQMAQTTVRAIIDATVQFLRRDPSVANVELEVHGGDCTLLADADMLRIVFVNLLLNAAEATGGTGQIDLAIETVDRECRVRVRDSGPGILPDVQEQMFQPFFTTKHRGTGLGLPTARRIIEMHQGEISVDCPPEGGTVVTVTLPRP